MLEPTACRFWQAALQSGLLDAPGLQACWDALPPEKRTPDAIDRRMARQAVQSGRLTLWQAQQLVAGRSSGFRIDRYVLLELIGQGGMGRVYLARDTRLGRRVAIKILSPERTNNPRAIARFHREAMVGAQLQHENLVRVYDEGEANGRCYLVMEFIEGRNIGQMIAESGPVPPPVAARLTRQVALGLEHAQRKGLIHRDVNPYNILVTREGTAKLTDLGLAIDLADQERVTRDGATVGTFDYVSPEQARHSHSVDTRSDIYSLGCTLYHMVTGRVPFPSASLPEKLFGHQAGEPESIASLAPGVPPGLAAVVSRMMRKSPDERYATPLELAQALEPYADETGAGSPGDVTPPVHTLNAMVAAARAAAAASASVSTSSHSDAGTGSGTGSGSGPGPGTGPGTGGEPVPVFAGSPSPNEAPAVAAATAAPAAATVGGRGLLGLDIQVDLGPEPSLSDSLSSSRARARSRGPKADPAPAKPAADGTAAAPARARSTRVLVTAGVAAGVLVGAGLFVAATRWDWDAWRKGAPASTAATGDAGKGKGTPVSASRALKGKEVEVVAADGSVTTATDLGTAVLAAVGGRGHVLLRNTQPLRLDASEALSVGGGHLTIRAAEGTRPELHVEVKGVRPFLKTNSNGSLRLEGLTVVARFTGAGPDPAPVIEASGDVVLDRCAFRVELAPGAEANPDAGVGTRAVRLEGGALGVNNCLFVNFDRALDVDCFGGVTTKVKQSMFVRGRQAGPAPTGGWAVRLRSMAGGFSKSGRRLELDHCTVQGRGLLEAVGFSHDSQVQVNVTRCVVQADALIMWGPGRKATAKDATPETLPPGRDSLSWRGQGNQYDLRGKSWVLLAPRGGPPQLMPDGPTDLASWALLAGTERDPLHPPVRFRTDPSSLPDRPTPRDFSPLDQGDGIAAGADPVEVGPASRPASR